MRSKAGGCAKIDRDCSTISFRLKSNIAIVRPGGKEIIRLDMHFPG